MNGVVSDDEESISLMRHLLLNQIVPRFLASNGALVLHASAVTLKNGKTAAFLGNSGFGKSTLACSFHNEGAQLIDDDCILIMPVGGRVAAIGGVPGVRLFPDSMNAVFSETLGFDAYSPYTDKQQKIFSESTSVENKEPALLDAVFLLNDPKLEEFAGNPLVEEMSGSEAMMAMIYCAFSLDPSDKQMLTRNFAHIGNAIGDQLGTYRLSYPRDHKRLADVRAAVEGCFGAQD